MVDLGHIPGPIVIPDCVQMRLGWTLADGKTVFNVLHARVATGFTPSAAIASTVLGAITSSAAWTSAATLLHTSTTLALCDLRDLRAADLALFQSTTGSASGVAVVGPLPAAASVVVTFRTAFAGRAFRGRAFMPGLDKGALDSTSNLGTGAPLTIKLLWEEIQSAMLASGLTLAIGQPARAAYTGRTLAVHAARAAHAEPVTSIEVRGSHLGNQRRRAVPN